MRSQTWVWEVAVLFCDLTILEGISVENRSNHAMCLDPISSVTSVPIDQTHLGILDLDTTVRTAILGQSNLAFKLNTEILELLVVLARTTSVYAISLCLSLQYLQRLPNVDIFSIDLSTARQCMIRWLLIRITCLGINIKSILKSLDLMRRPIRSAQRESTLNWFRVPNPILVNPRLPAVLDPLLLCPLRLRSVMTC